MPEKSNRFMNPNTPYKLMLRGLIGADAGLAAYILYKTGLLPHVSFHPLGLEDFGNSSEKRTYHGAATSAYVGSLIGGATLLPSLSYLKSRSEILKNKIQQRKNHRSGPNSIIVIIDNEDFDNS